MKYPVCPFCQSEWRIRSKLLGDKECDCGAYEGCCDSGTKKRFVFIVREPYQIAWYENDETTVWKDSGIVYDGNMLPFDITPERLDKLMMLR